MEAGWQKLACQTPRRTYEFEAIIGRKKVRNEQIKLPKNPGDTGWKEILPKRKVNPKLSDHLNADY